MSRNAGEVLLWVILPYLAFGFFVVGHWWRYRRDQFRWTTRSTQLLDKRVLGWASPAFHFGILTAAGGHIIGLIVPQAFTDSLGISEHTYHWFAFAVGGVAGVITVIGFLGLVYRRMVSERVRRTTTRLDLVTYGLLTLMIVLGCYMTAWNGLVAEPFNYRDSVGAWWRSLFVLQPDVEAIRSAPWAYQAHAVTAWAFWAAFPFTRLVHVWSVPLAYIGRPYILYRRRYSTGERIR